MYQHVPVSSLLSFYMVIGQLCMYIHACVFLFKFYSLKILAKNAFIFILLGFEIALRDLFSVIFIMFSNLFFKEENPELKAYQMGLSCLLSQRHWSSHLRVSGIADALWAHTVLKFLYFSSQFLRSISRQK